MKKHFGSRPFSSSLVVACPLPLLKLLEAFLVPWHPGFAQANRHPLTGSHPFQSEKAVKPTAELQTFHAETPSSSESLPRGLSGPLDQKLFRSVTGTIIPMSSSCPNVFQFSMDILIFEKSKCLYSKMSENRSRFAKIEAGERESSL